jgi:LTXXQ motif family protein
LPPSTSAEAAIDRRIHMLQERLAITAAQLPLWEAVAHAIREDAQTTDAMFAQRAAAVASMSAVANMDSYARAVRAYADNTQRLRTPSTASMSACRRREGTLPTNSFAGRR